MHLMRDEKSPAQIMPGISHPVILLWRAFVLHRIRNDGVRMGAFAIILPDPKSRYAKRDRLIIFPVNHGWDVALIMDRRGLANSAVNITKSS